MDYIKSVDNLSGQMRLAALPPEQEIQAAIRVLSQSPVSGYTAFSEEEVRLIGAYRASWGPQTDFVWRSIVEGDPEAWFYAVQEAGELQAFAEMGVNAFDRGDALRNMEEAHLRATIFELHYVKDWSKQMGLEVPEIAIETENPIRKFLVRRHAEFVSRLQLRTGWPAPTEAELEAARLFWQKLRERGTP